MASRLINETAYMAVVYLCAHYSKTCVQNLKKKQKKLILNVLCVHLCVHL